MFSLSDINGKINILSCVSDIGANTSEGIIYGRIKKVLNDNNISYVTNCLDFNKYEYNIFLSCYYIGSDILSIILETIHKLEKINTRCIFYPYILDFFSSNNIDADTMNKVFINAKYVSETSWQQKNYTVLKFDINQTMISPIGIEIPNETIDYKKNKLVIFYIKLIDGIDVQMEQFEFIKKIIPVDFEIKLFTYSLNQGNEIRYDHNEYIRAIKNAKFVVYYSPYETLGYANVEFRVYNIPFFALSFPSVHYYNDNCEKGHDSSHSFSLDNEIITKSGFICHMGYMDKSSIATSFIKFMQYIDNEYFLPKYYICKYLNIENQIKKFFV